jgi:aryl-alcohol dehydrogenase-like predicted oxidoreductase
MEYRQLGGSDLWVSEISLGSWLTYGVGVERTQAEECVNRAFDVGINFFDTANAYGRGAAETVLGEILKGRDRSSYLVATKVFFPMSSTDKGLSAEQIRRQCDASLSRLGTGHIDLYQCHRYDRDTPLEETMGALTELVRQGKVRYLGFSEWSPAQIRASAELSGVEHFVSSQPQYSMLWRRPEREVFPACEEVGVNQIVWSPLAQGVLTGKYRPGSPPPRDSRAASESMGQMMGDYRSDAVLAAVEGLRSVASDLGLSMGQLALAWVLRTPTVSSAIIGASRAAQIDEDAAASGVSLDSDALTTIDEVLSPVL